MEGGTLVNLLDSHNEVSIIATKRFKPREVIFIYKQGKKEETELDNLKKYYLRIFPTIIFIAKAIEKFNIDELDKIINKYKSKDILINVTSGPKIFSLALLYIGEKYDLRCMYLDIENKELITFSKDVDISYDEYVDINVNEMIESKGGSIIIDSTEGNNSLLIDEITDLIANNLSTWERLKYRIYDTSVFIHNEFDSTNMKLDESSLTKEELDIYNKILVKLKESRQIDYHMDQNGYINIKFLNNYIKSFIFKSGSWLEAYTKKIVEQIRQIDDVKSGMLFLWDDEKSRVKNELDVVAIKDSVLICISCKDSAKYDEIALNELNVYSHQLGGENVIKILVATKIPVKNSVIERAREMNINLVIFDGNKIKFQEKLRKIILRK